MKTILIATDFSESAKNASDYGLHIAKAFEAKVILLHIYMLPTPVSEVPYLFTPFDDIQHENEKELQNEVQRLSALVNQVEIQPIVSIGLPATSIVETATESNTDLIIMGMKQYTSGIEKLIGSTLDEVIRLSKIPVLAVPPVTSFEPVSTITYATDFSYKLNSLGINLLKTLLEVFKAHLQVVNIKRPDAPETPDQLNARNIIQNLLSEIDFKFYTHVNAKVEDGLKQFLMENHSQILVMVAHRHNFFSRLFGIEHTKEMLHRTYIPLLVLNEKK